MKKIIFILIPFFLTGTVGFSQQLVPQVISAGGAFEQGTDANVAWTLGEVSIETYAQSNIILTQGFHQIELHPTAIEEKNISIQLDIFPNPTPDIIACSLDNGLELPLEIILSDIHGKILQYSKMTTKRYELNLSGFPSGYYLLTIRKPMGTTSTTCKIFKVNY